MAKKERRWGVAALVGIARMAAESPRLEAKRTVEYLSIAARSYVTRCSSDRVPFRWTINPYRGCEFGCKYCYARYAHEFMDLRDPLDFERRIFAKQFDPGLFRAELERLPGGEAVALGTATDPYQPAERRFRITRAMLEVFAQTAGLRLGITTKSDLVARDIDVFQEIARRHYLSISLTVTTMDRELARLIEPLAPRPDLRIAAVRKLRRAGIGARVFCAPVLPLINDADTSLDAIAQAAATAGAKGFGGNVLFLKPCAKQVFMPFLEERFPLLVRKYRERFERNAYIRGDYPGRIQERIARIRRRYGFDQMPKPQEPQLWPRDAQLTLFTEEPAL
ncbi:MAG: radical SAM protein [Bryobacterales bacterium]|nr:radical SAM protein [Bryobacterales bacterium]MBV9398066.1 radical SAM protein [Bryobacterales bacterium]